MRFLLGHHLDRKEAELGDFLANPVVELLLADEEAARTYAEIVVNLLRTGTPVPTNDVWIAAVAARSGATVMTYDSHFTTISCIGSLVLAEPHGINDDWLNRP